MDACWMTQVNGGRISLSGQCAGMHISHLTLWGANDYQSKAAVSGERLQNHKGTAPLSFACSTQDEAHAQQEPCSCCLTIPCTGAFTSQVWVQLAAATSHSLNVPS